MKQPLITLTLFVLITPVSANEISKADWIQAMETALPAAFCKPKEYFRQCYTISAIECEETAASTTRICLKKFKEQIPDTLIQPNDGAQWGTKVGECAGAAFDLSMSESRIDSDLCNDPANWQ